MTERHVWMRVKGLAVDTGRLQFDVQGKENERIGTLFITESSITWRSAHKRKCKTSPIPWEDFDELMQYAKEKSNKSLRS